MTQIITTAMIIYLLIQSIIDIKTKTVFVFLNNIMLAILGVLYIYDIFTTNSFSILETAQVALIITTIFFMSGYLGWYGIGDAKAMVAIMLSLRYISPQYPQADIFLLLITILIANILFIVFYKIKNMIQKKLTEKDGHAFFPFLLISYIITVLIN